MFLFAHVFLGALIGCGFWLLTHDRRALLLCILGAILPDLLDKSLALLIPGIFGFGRTLGHAMLFFAVAVAIGLLLWYYRNTLLGMAFACAIFSHQVLDSMWALASVWLYPFMGPFPVIIFPDYVGHYFWLELSTVSEWLFAFASAVIIVLWYTIIPENRPAYLTGRRASAVRITTALLLGVMGMDLLLFGYGPGALAVFAPTYDPVTGMMAGLIALSGAVFLAIVYKPDRFNRGSLT